MIAKITVGQARYELASKNEFLIKLDSPQSSVKISGLFYDVCFSLSSHPYAVFRNELSQITLREIKSIWREQADDCTIYLFLCTQRVDGTPKGVFYQVECREFAA